MKSSFTVGCFGMIFSEKGEILLCHRNDMDLWNLPGGMMESGETPEQCVLREIKEETCVDAKVSRLAGIYVKPDQDDIVFSFECRIVSGEPTTSDEAQEVRYFSVDALPSNTSPKQVVRILDALQNPDTTLLLTQTGKSSRELLAEGKL